MVNSRTPNAAIRDEELGSIDYWQLTIHQKAWLLRLVSTGILRVTTGRPLLSGLTENGAVEPELEETLKKIILPLAELRKEYWWGKGYSEPPLKKGADFDPPLAIPPAEILTLPSHTH
jgi:hypothetical protein